MFSWSCIDVDENVKSPDESWPHRLAHSGDEAREVRGSYDHLMLEVRGVKTIYLTPNNVWVMWCMLMFLSSVAEHIFMPKTNQNAGFWPKKFKKIFRGATPGPPRRQEDTPRAPCPSRLPCFVRAHYFRRYAATAGSAAVTDICLLAVCCKATLGSILTDCGRSAVFALQFRWNVDSWRQEGAVDLWISRRRGATGILHYRVKRQSSPSWSHCSLWYRTENGLLPDLPWLGMRSDASTCTVLKVW